MSHPLLLDEMFSDGIAQQLRAKAHDVISVVADPALVALPDEQPRLRGRGGPGAGRQITGRRTIPRDYSVERLL
jgi:hypothetical protein